MTDATYVCSGSSEAERLCPYDCIGLASCESCDCATQDVGGGDWGKFMDVIFCLTPIIFLLLATLAPKPLPTTVSLPTAAILMFLIRLMYLGSDPLLTAGSVISGLHEAITPLSIMAGAITLFETMEVTNCMPFMMREMKVLTNGHAAAELMIIFSFAYMIEGASGFGTPVALGAPMLASLGHAKFDCVVVLLLMNTFATVWGAAGTPIWFGLGNLDLTEDDFLNIAFKAAVALAVSAFVLVPLILTMLIPFPMLRANSIFIVLSLASCVLMGLGLSVASYEFPSLLGGIVGMAITGLLIHFRIGLTAVEMKEDEATGRHPMDVGTISEYAVVAPNSDAMMSIRSARSQNVGSIRNENGSSNTRDKDDEEAHIDKTGEESDSNGDDMGVENHGAAYSIGKDTEKGETSSVDSEEGDIRDSQRAIRDALGPRKSLGEGYLNELFLRTLPIWLTVILLILTRVPQIGIKEVLTDREPSFSIHFGTYGTFFLSASLVMRLDNILTYPNLDWKYELLYVPFLIPFVAVSLITLAIFRKESTQGVKGISRTVLGRLQKPAVALAGALVLVQLMIKGGEASPASIIGTVISEALVEGWIVVAAFTGALGSFFSGSTTISNLTFGRIQLIAAENMGTSATSMLALQAAGASAGNGICLNNIISACTVVGLDVSEGKIIGRTWKGVAASCTISTVVMLIAFFRFA